MKPTAKVSRRYRGGDAGYAIPARGGTVVVAPGGLMDVLHQVDPISLQCVCSWRGIVRFKVEAKMFPFIHEFDRGVLLVYEFQVKELTARPNTCVKVLVLELERGVKPY